MDNIEITVKNHGSIKVAGSNIVLKDADGKLFDLGGRESISLCRCGKSANKPFCDGAHKSINFNSMIEARVLPPKISS